jgi:isochorismate synthase
MPLIDHLLASGLSFATYRYPNSQEVMYVASETFETVEKDQLHGVMQRNGFVWAPFDVERHPILFIPNDIAEPQQVCTAKAEPIVAPFVGFPSHFANSEEYQSQVAALANGMSVDGLQKAILSRVLPSEFKPDNTSRLFTTLCRQYPGAYVFCVFTPYSGLWVGATPELFLTKDNDAMSTVALAGTRRAAGAKDNDKVWQLKELEEQAIVSGFIADVLSSHSVEAFEQIGPVQIQAGQVSHLKTTFRFRAHLNAHELVSLALSLHPTPAVSGLPKQSAMSTISTIEKHDRAYYGGFLGHVNHLNCHLFVALRCMMVSDDQAFLFVGGGITHQSNAEAEWDETVLKSQTLLSVLKNI